MRDSKFVRGQIWWFEGYETHKGALKRPCVIISNDDINSNPTNGSITVIPLTSNMERTDIATNIAFDRHTRTKNVIRCSEITTLYKSQLVSYESTLDDEAMKAVEKGVRIALGLETKIEPQFFRFKPKTEEPKTEEPKTEQSIDGYPAVIFKPKDEDKQEDKEEQQQDDYEVKKAGVKTRWDAENEALFMKLYTEGGIKAVTKKFGMSSKTAMTRAYMLRKKYPEFKKRGE